MEERKSSRVHPHFVLGSSPFRIPSPPPCALLFAGFTNSNQWFIEEGGEKLASEIKGMLMDFIRGIHAVCNLSLCGIFLVILDFIRGVYAVYFRWQNDLSHIIVWFAIFCMVKCTESRAHLHQIILSLIIVGWMMKVIWNCHAIKILCQWILLQRATPQVLCQYPNECICHYKYCNDAMS